jgi:hypothetical protein
MSSESTLDASLVHPLVGIKEPKKLAKRHAQGVDMSPEQMALVALGFRYDCRLPIEVALDWESAFYPMDLSDEAIDRYKVETRQLIGFTFVSFDADRLKKVRVADRRRSELEHDLKLIEKHLGTLPHFSDAPAEQNRHGPAAPQVFPETADRIPADGVPDATETISAPAGETTPATPHVSPETKVDDEQSRAVAKLAPSRMKAYGQYLDAMVKNPTELNGATDRVVYDWLKRHLEEDETLPTFATWSRYVRDAREFYETQKNLPRAGRLPGKSVVREDQIEREKAEEHD